MSAISKDSSHPLKNNIISNPHLLQWPRWCRVHLADSIMSYVHAPAGKVAFITTRGCLDIKYCMLPDTAVAWDGVTYPRQQSTH